MRFQFAKKSQMQAAILRNRRCKLRFLHVALLFFSSFRPETSSAPAAFPPSPPSSTSTIFSPSPASTASTPTSSSPRSLILPSSTPSLSAAPLPLPIAGRDRPSAIGSLLVAHGSKITAFDPAFRRRATVLTRFPAVDSFLALSPSLTAIGFPSLQLLDISLAGYVAHALHWFPLPAPPHIAHPSLPPPSYSSRTPAALSSSLRHPWTLALPIIFLIILSPFNPSSLLLVDGPISTSVHISTSPPLRQHARLPWLSNRHPLPSFLPIGTGGSGGGGCGGSGNQWRAWATQPARERSRSWRPRKPVAPAAAREEERARRESTAGKRVRTVAWRQKAGSKAVILVPWATRRPPEGAEEMADGRSWPGMGRAGERWRVAVDEGDRKEKKKNSRATCNFLRFLRNRSLDLRFLRIAACICAFLAN